MARYPNVLGLAEGLANVGGVQELLEAAAAATHKTLAGQAADEIKANAPVDTGKLRSTVHVEAGRKQGQEVVVVGDDSTFYLGFQEFGTYHQDARPFVRPAISRAEAVYQTTMEDGAIQGIRRLHVKGISR